MDPDRSFHVWLFHAGPDGMRLDEAFGPTNFSDPPAGPAGPRDMLLK